MEWYSKANDVGLKNKGRTLSNHFPFKGRTLSNKGRTLSNHFPLKLFNKAIYNL